MTPTVHRLRLDGLRDAVPAARRLVRAALAGTAAESLTFDAEVVAAELATNAILHGTDPVEFTISLIPEGVRLEARDSSVVAPVRALGSADNITGRGLALVNSLAARWGVEPAPNGKVVWAELHVSDEPVEEVEFDPAAIDELLAQWADAAESESAPKRFTVVVGDVPTDLLLRAKAHVDNLVREFALAAGGAASGTTAAVPEHLAALIDDVTTRFADPRHSIKRQALAAAAAGDERTRLVLTLPASAADAGLRYLTALDEADSYARAARLLTLETPPEHRAFRQWYVRSIVEQLRAAERGDPPVRPVTFEQHLLGELGEITKAQRAAERAARLQTVTAALARATVVSEVAAAVVTEGVAVLGASGGALVTPADDDHVAIPGSVGYPPALVEAIESEHRDAALPAAVVLRTGEAIWIESPDDRDETFPALVALEPSARSLCAVPLNVGTALVGALRFSFDSPRLFDEDERRFVLALAAQAAQALDRANLLATERAARARTAFLADALELLTSSLQPNETLAHLVSLLVPTVADWGVVYLLDDHGVAKPMAVAHRDPATGDLMRRIVEQQPLDMEARDGVGEVLRTGQTIRYTVVPDAVRRRATSAVENTPDADAIRPRTGIAAPLIARGRVIGALAVARTREPAYTEYDEALVRDLAARAAVAVLNAQAFQRERDTAIALQRALLPQRPPAVAGARFAWRYLPASAGDTVGGDWYDVIDLDDGRVALAIGDVLGRGVQAAAVMGQLRATLRAYAAADVSPAEMLARLDIALGRLEQSQATTAAFAVLDATTRTVTIASAGHLPPLVVSPSAGAEFVDVAPGPPLGTGARDYAESTITLPPGAILLFYTDGLVEDRARSIEDGMAALRDALVPATGAEDACDRALAATAVAGAPDDDVVVLAVALLP